jgi:MgtC family protein
MSMRFRPCKFPVTRPCLPPLHQAFTGFFGHPQPSRVDGKGSCAGEALEPCDVGRPWRRVSRLLTALFLVSFVVGVTSGPPFGPLHARQVAQVAPDPLATQPPTPAEEEISRWTKLKQAARALPLATGLGTALAMRPRRRSTAPRSPAVIQTQIILALIGALVMLVVGSSLARAFGVVGAAGLVRYRAKIDDPKDAGVMLSTLAVGLASGVGLYFLAVFSTGFIIVVLTIVEWFEPEPFKVFTLTVKTKEAAKVQPAVEAILRRQRVRSELRSSSDEEVSFQVRVPYLRRTDAMSKMLLEVEGATAVEWNEDKKKAQGAD